MPDSNAVITRTELITRAFSRIGIKHPSAGKLAFAAPILNDVFRELDPECRWLWTISNTPTVLTLTASNRYYSVATPPTGIPSYIVDIEHMELVSGSNIIAQLRSMTKTESLESTLREGTGQPVAYHLEVAASTASNRLVVLPTPNATYTANYTYRRMIYDMDTASGNPDLPQGWNLKAERMLAYELAPHYGVSVQERLLLKSEKDESLIKGIKANADKAEARPPRTLFY